jgi:CRISP-associated protein Cas1
VIGRIVELSDDRRHLHMDRGFLVVKSEGEELGRIPLDDIAAVIGNAHGLTYTNNILVALAERKAPFVLCAANHSPVAILWPLEGNYEQSGRFDAQIAATKPLNKNLWAQIVKAKLEQQAGVLKAVQQPYMPIEALIPKVRSGDPDNIEAQAARRYWTLLFGEGFRRDREADGINALLNYGYMVLRAAVARSILAAGLHPSIGLHHSNVQNAMRLTDDLMEPFRPLIDWKIYRLNQEGKDSVIPETKRSLVNVLYSDMHTKSGVTPVMACLQRLAVSLAQIYMGERSLKDGLDLPLPGLPLEFVD